MSTQPNPNPAPATTCGYAPDPRPKWKRVLAKVWPSKHNFAGDPAWALDAIRVETDVTLSFSDLLRVLVSGRLRVNSTTFTEHVVGRIESKSVAYPLPPLFAEDKARATGVPPRPIPSAPPRPMTGSGSHYVPPPSAIPPPPPRPETKTPGPDPDVAALLARTPPVTPEMKERLHRAAEKADMQAAGLGQSLSSEAGLSYSLATDVVNAKRALHDACKAFDDAVRAADPSKGHSGAASEVEVHGSILGNLQDALNLIVCEAGLRSSAAKKLSPDERRAVKLAPKA
jgi:hypothetical protein